MQGQHQKLSLNLAEKNPLRFCSLKTSAPWGTLMKKIFAALILASSVALVGTTPVAASTYVPDTPVEVEVIPNDNVLSGDAFIFRGSGFNPGEGLTITVTLENQAASVSAGSLTVPTQITMPLPPLQIKPEENVNGSFRVEMRIMELGRHTITATGNVSAKQDSDPVRVVPAIGAASSKTDAVVAGTGSRLANTGIDSGLLLWTLVGAGALATGATSVAIARRRAKTA
ncbi:LPXTG-motif cell wall-anchored protein [Pseudarthrobacter sp. W1I19]|uniref:LPXTG cell wall anchor domain-containing protein n=1 Tax=Pseudarthrobacter sp. W1I19 TaxID=3042288 RepID=UPI00277E2DC6|nr:LPXTG cell wall anchor domain-containing protein [Pseudarthrobacter sp. W1I19]MDQ0922267.1 LPXTG-motif cell wall-anchored protein [Pseudarthrobacter sp. W1I19]